MLSTVKIDEKHFSDKRLARRCNQIINSWSNYPTSSIPKRAASTAEVKATYRFLSSANVSYDDLLAGFRDSTVKLIQSRQDETLLVIQDSSTLNFTSKPQTKGLGYINKIRPYLETNWRNTNKVFCFTLL